MVSLYVKDGRRYQPATSDVICGAAREIALDTIKTTGVDFRDPAAAYAFLVPQFAGLEHEEFGVAFLNTRMQLRAFERMFRGTVDSAPVFAREVVKATLKHNATYVAFAHNHPSGFAHPSLADISVTENLKAALALIEVRVVDHIIVAGTSTCSMAALGHV